MFSFKPLQTSPPVCKSHKAGSTVSRGLGSHLPTFSQDQGLNRRLIVAEQTSGSATRLQTAFVLSSRDQHFYKLITGKHGRAFPMLLFLLPVAFGPFSLVGRLTKEPRNGEAWARGAVQQVERLFSTHKALGPIPALIK